MSFSRTALRPSSTVPTSITSSPVRSISSVYRFAVMPLCPATKPVIRSCICSNHRMVWGMPRIIPE